MTEKKKEYKSKREYVKPEVIKVSEEVIVGTAACCSGYCHNFV